MSQLGLFDNWGLDDFLRQTAGYRGNGRVRGGKRGNHRPNMRAKSQKQGLPAIYEPNKVYVANIKNRVSEQQLKEFFSSFATVVDVIIIRRPYSSQFGFVTFANEEDAQRILKLEKPQCFLSGSYLDIKPARMRFPLPGDPSFVRVSLPDRDFDLTPLDPNAASMHVLIDDVVLRIFEYLPLKNLILVERVCRRWQSLVHESFRTKAMRDIKGDLDLWLTRNEIIPNYVAVSKFLILCGNHLTKFSFGNVSPINNHKLLKIIGQLCPEIRSLKLATINTTDKNLKEFLMACPKITEFQIKESCLSESQLIIILQHLTALEVFSLPTAYKIEGSGFVHLPNTLKVLNISDCVRVSQASISHIVDRCPLLEVLRLDGIGIPSNMLVQIGTRCTGLKELGINVIGLSTNVDLTPFVNLKKLTYYGVMNNINKLMTDLPHLEELVLEDAIRDLSINQIDFSVLPELRVLNLPMLEKISLTHMSLKTLAECSKLEKFRFPAGNEHKPAILEIIRRCHSLKEIDIPTVTLCGDDIANFVDANKHRNQNRKNTLKMIIGLDHSALDQIEKLNDANYEIEMFDAHNLFSDFEDAYAYNEDFDDYELDSDRGSPDIEEMFEAYRFYKYLDDDDRDDLFFSPEDMLDDYRNALYDYDLFD